MARRSIIPESSAGTADEHRRAEGARLETISAFGMRDFGVPKAEKSYSV